MRIPHALQGERGFWIVLIGGVILVFFLLFGWALPTYQASRAAEDSLSRTQKLLQLLGEKPALTPSDQTRKDREEFNVWLDTEAGLVERFFAGRAALVDSPIHGGDKVAPEDFKEAYKDALRRQRRWLQKNSRAMTVADMNRAFPMYKWVTSSELPSPSEYPAVRRAYWSHVYLYQKFLRGKVRAVKNLRILDTKPVVARANGATLSEFEGLNFAADLEVAPDRIGSLLTRLLIVDPPGPDSTQDPVIQLKSLEVQALASVTGGQALCSVKITGYMLVQRLASTPAGG